MFRRLVRAGVGTGVGIELANRSDTDNEHAFNPALIVAIWLGVGDGLWLGIGVGIDEGIFIFAGNGIKGG